MASCIPLKIREKIVQARKSGMSYRLISDRYGYSESGIKKIWYQYRDKGDQGLSLKYSNCGKKGSYDQSVRDLITSQRSGLEGAPFIRSVLSEKYPDRKIPHERTIQRWWKASGVHRPKGRPSKPQANWTRLAHEVWQIDGKEQIELGSGEELSWLNIVDEGSKAQLSTKVSPPQNDGPSGSKISDEDGQS